jgi:hypothetical protein
MSVNDLQSLDLVVVKLFRKAKVRSRDLYSTFVLVPSLPRLIHAYFTLDICAPISFGYREANLRTGICIAAYNCAEMTSPGI